MKKSKFIAIVASLFLILATIYHLFGDCSVWWITYIKCIKTLFYGFLLIGYIKSGIDNFAIHIILCVFGYGVTLTVIRLYSAIVSGGDLIAYSRMMNSDIFANLVTQITILLTIISIINYVRKRK